MKITRSHLRRIIREELGIINEQPMDGPLRGDPSFIAYQHRPQAVKDSNARAVQSLIDTLDDGYDMVQDAASEVVEIILDNPDTMNAISLGAKSLGFGLTLFPEPVSTAAGLAILKGSVIFDVAAAAGYAREGDRNEVLFSVLSAVLFANAKNAQQFYRSASNLRNKLRNLVNDKSVFYLLKKGTPPWAWAGAALALEVGISAASEAAAALKEAGPDDEDSEVIESLEAFIIDAQQIKESIDLIMSA